MTINNVTHFNNLDVVNANSVDEGLFLGGVLITATAEQLNAVTGTAAAATVTATRALTADDNSKLLLLSAITGLTITLPAATGTGNIFNLAVLTSVTSNNYVIQVANATDIMIGDALLYNNAAASGFVCASTSDTITMNGSTKGGLVGARVMIQDVAAGIFLVKVNSAGTSTLATPFSATVS